ncbi:three-Cys-motif partner protein TcmP [Nocardia goodfellowii]|uniref:Three-Cys-motif partner protein n=1 Tax=Nocardia goodfellowii TaxID=882446 RepID=A0ABS4QPI1_9NOCA|nr:three-Cys-motif partner protein TcmP [Nocardia goodfellowii]MBP2193617.1 three-Cys-motif partner protein [Nocardia goodfellowii]
MAREWSYWTNNKLLILDDYVAAFNKASQSAKDRIYLDLMAGQPENIERHTGTRIDGSPRRVLSADPGFTRHVFFELPGNAEKLERTLRKDFPNKGFHVIAGDCNETIDRVLADLQPFNRAPAFAFIDQQAAEVDWSTIVKIANFKARTRSKPELWLLVSPTFVARGVRGTNRDLFRQRVTRFYGSDKWLIIQAAREGNEITPDQYRDEMTNLIRFRLAQHLGYRFTHRIPMRMTNRTTIYDMVFATDHPAGDRIMRHLYAKAAAREPQMMADARRLAKIAQEEKTGLLTLFEPPVVTPDAAGQVLWQPEAYWWPSSREWWGRRSRVLQQPPGRAHGFDEREVRP